MTKSVLRQRVFQAPTGLLRKCVEGVETGWLDVVCPEGRYGMAAQKIRPKVLDEAIECDARHPVVPPGPEVEHREHRDLHRQQAHEREAEAVRAVRRARAGQ